MKYDSLLKNKKGNKSWMNNTQVVIFLTRQIQNVDNILIINGKAFTSVVDNSTFFSFQDCMDRVVFKHQAMGDFDTNVYSHDRIILTNINHRIINKCSASCPWLLPTDGLIIMTQELSNFNTSTLTKNQFAIGIEINDEQWKSNLQVIILSVLPLNVPGRSSMLYLL